MCQGGTESIDHLLRECVVAQKFWQDQKSPYCLRDSFMNPIEKWLELNCKSVISSNVMRIPWKLLFAMGDWHLWLHRNNFAFKTGKVDHMIFQKCIKDGAEFYSTGMKTKAQNYKAIIPVGQEKPPEGWVKLNSDGSALGNSKRTGGRCYQKSRRRMDKRVCQITWLHQQLHC